MAEFLTELLDGLVVELVYTQQVEHSEADAEGVAAHRSGPGDWTTTLVVHIAGGAAALSAAGQSSSGLPTALADLAKAAFRAADAIGRQSGLDGNVITPPMQRALQESVVIEVVTGQLERLSTNGRDALSYRGVVTAILSELERVTTITIEGEAPSLGVVMLANPSETAGVHRFPQDYQQQRAPLLFDGRTAVLVIDADGRAVHEVQRARLERTLNTEELAAANSYLERFDSLDGSAVVAVSNALNGVGFYARHDRSILVCIAGPPLVVKQRGHWRSIPSGVLASGIAELIGAPEVANLVIETALLLSLEGHGAILAVADSAASLDTADLVPAKDRLDRVDPGAAETPIHDVIDVGDLDAGTLRRFAAIDGACILDRSCRLLTYGAVVSSYDSAGEGARTAAARYLSEHLEIVVKVSEDGPITVYQHGSEIGRLLD